MEPVLIALPIHEIAKELTEVIITQCKHEVNKLFLNIVIEDILYSLALAYVENILNIMIQDKNKDKEAENKIENLATFCNLDVNILEKKLFNSSAYKYFFNLLDTYVTGGEWDVWEVHKVKNNYFLKYVGNYIIMEWERDHVRNGVYSKIPYVSED